jgi:Polyprenyl synthetase
VLCRICKSDLTHRIALLLSYGQDVVADLHNSSLLLDDIEDNSKLRRGIPVAHSIFGVPTVINCANYVFFLALEKCHAWNNPEAMKVNCVSRKMIQLLALYHSFRSFMFPSLLGFRWRVTESASWTRP